MIKQNLASRLISEFAPADSANDIMRVLDPIFPEPELHPNGFYFFKPEEVTSFNELFDRFGLKFRATDPAFEDIRYLTEVWYRLVNGFGSQITCYFHSPKLFQLEVAEWPTPFREYLAAVMSDDRARSRELAAELRIEDLTTAMPGPTFN